MSFWSAEMFARKHGGLDGLLKFVRLCNSNPCAPLDTIGDAFDLSRSQVCRLRATLLLCQWHPKVGTTEFIEFHLRACEHEVTEKRQAVRDAVPPRLILLKTSEYRNQE